MMIVTISGLQIEYASVENYLDSLVNKFFKILPMREESEASLIDYMCGLRRELIGFGGLVPEVGTDRIFMSVLSMLQYFIDNIYNDNCSLQDVRSEVFHIISMCNKLKMKYHEGGDE